MWLVNRLPQRSFVYLVSVYVLDPNCQPVPPPLIHFENGELGIVRKYFGGLFSALSFDFPSHGITYGGHAIAISTKKYAPCRQSGPGRWRSSRERPAGSSGSGGAKRKACAWRAISIARNGAAMYVDLPVAGFDNPVLFTSNLRRVTFALSAMSAVSRLSPQQRKSERKSNPTLSANNCREQAQQNCGYSITSSARATRELRARLKARAWAGMAETDQQNDLL